MKNKLVIFTIALAAFVTAGAFAQESPELKIKVLPSRPGYAKVLYAMKKTSPVTVRFIADGKVILTDEIKDGPFEKGFLKWYNIEKLNRKEYMVQVSDMNTTVTYRIVPVKGSPAFSAHLEHVRYDEAYVASK